MTTQLTLFTPPPAAPVAPAVPSGRYFRDGRFVLPEGERQPSKGLFCIMDPAGAPQDALRILVVYDYDRRTQRTVALECPALNRRWEAGDDWCGNAFDPCHAAILAWAAAELGLSPDVLGPLCYTTSAWAGEDRAVIRDEPHLGPIRERVERRGRR
ncbi:hypothetical protein G3N56_07950 [Desulfovibrio sulfodismutans]|uniref:Uncharacterized protein n=1 Tax=Desulfolutivibrio sulfodismutans TaxID=63561 RepID=A0A7K3NLL6_9BACT|nr:hypothetical protein [Desulfolutivibrio sulfodismutans]NDY56675.1 hypothetical protein [Desulfolutivibrio sulfodismutans]QLA11224.1 hypothetical protein GD606_02505 [Desulfolutivibrio sulfodismutans DSM 3696]